MNRLKKIVLNLIGLAIVLSCIALALAVRYGLAYLFWSAIFSA